MGVDSNLYMSLSIPEEAIAYAFAKAMGEEPPRDTGNEENIFSASEYVKATTVSTTMWHIEIPEHGIHCRPSLHLSQHTAFGPCWLLIARSYADVIAVFRTVAEVLGGLLVYRDSDDKGQYFCPLEDYAFMRVHNAVCATPLATITPADQQEASYT